MKASVGIEVVMNVAATEAIEARFSKIEPEHLLMALLKLSELNIDEIAERDDRERFQEVLEIKTILSDLRIDSTNMRRRLRTAVGLGSSPLRGRTIHRSGESKRLFDVAENMAAKEGAQYLTAAHLLRAIISEPSPHMAGLLPLKLESSRKGEEIPFNDLLGHGPSAASPGDPPAQPSGLGALTQLLKELRDSLRRKVFGQDQAIQAFIEGVFNAEVVAKADEQRRRPKGIFVFAGPPGVGKTFLAESAAEALRRPFKRFDMSSFSDHQSGMSLIGIHKSYKDSHRGLLTEFVAKNPDAVLLFDEIEKAHLNVVHLFLQVLDAGRLEDAHTEKEVQFRDTIIIFTTNAGRALYDNPNSVGVYATQAGLHRKTILDALEKETDQRTGKPFFPQAICSRMATGYPVMFNHLGIRELEKVARAEFDRMSHLVEKEYSMKVTCGTIVPLCMLLREGVRTDARTIRSQVESFVKAEIFNFAKLLEPQRLEAVLKSAERIVIDLDSRAAFPEDVRNLLQGPEKPKVLLVTDTDLGELWATHVPEADWRIASDEPDVQNIIQTEDTDLIILDLLIGPGPWTQTILASDPVTMYQFDDVPFAARGIARGQEILRSVHQSRPELPCFLVSFGKVSEGKASLGEELLLACMQSGGARGVIETDFVSSTIAGWEEARDSLASAIQEAASKIHLEKQAYALGKERKALSFDTVPVVDSEGSVRIRLRNLRLSRALAADDVSEVLQDVERPNIRFGDVYGADAAKGELNFVVDWLREPIKFKAMGIRPPRGILLYGHPGTGKTMLARALAGECDAAFLVASAASFVTKWVGSGPENVRKLFARARNYAPAIVFIDEIDAIGKKRTGSESAGPREETLNALLTEMDGFGTPSARPLIVLAATNLVEHLDDALRRRFDRDIEVDKPDRAARAAYLRRRLQGTDFRCVTDAVIDRVAGQSANMTIAELERIIELAGRMAVMQAGKINDEVFEEAFERMRMGETRTVADQGSLLRTARHEAGHCIIGWLRGEKPVQISIVARGKAGGFVERESDEGKMVYTKADLQGMIRQAVGGRAAELVYYGEEDGLTTGVSSDLRAATHYAELMVRDYGMGDDIGQYFIDSRRLSDGPLATRVMEAAEKIIRAQLEQSATILREHRSIIDRLVDALMEKNRLTREELEVILDDLC